jgi:DNA modification methylase
MKTKNINPDIIIEPTCGVGNVLLTAYKTFNPQKTIGVEINNTYCKSILKKINGSDSIQIFNDNIFISINRLKKEIGDENICLFIGNPLADFLVNAEEA